MSRRALVPPIVLALLALAALAPAPAPAQTIGTVAAPADTASAGVTAAHVEAPHEIGLGTMAVSVWVRLTADCGPAPISGASLVLAEPVGPGKRLEMTPLDGRFDSDAEEVVATIDTYAWVEEGVHEYEIRARRGEGAEEAVVRGAIRVKPRITTPDLFLVDERGIGQPWLGSGAGGFLPARDLDTGLPAGRTLTADVDGDRREDVLIPGPAGVIHVYGNRGAGRFEPLREIFIGSPVVDAAVGDVDGDGKPDLVAVTTDSRVEVRSGVQDLTTWSAELTLLPDRVAIADLDRDGVPELYLALLGLNDGEIQVWTRQTESQHPSWAPSHRLPPPPGGRGRIRELLAVPVSNNANPRLLVLSGVSGEAMLEFWSAAADTNPERVPTCVGVLRMAGSPRGMVTGRLAGSGDLAYLVVVERGTGATLLELRDGEPPRRLLTFETAPTVVALLDLDGDDDDDLVTGGEDLRLWINVRGKELREAGESPYLLASPVVALVPANLDERKP